ncbi:type II secretion system F family protein [Synoicihabitans lomoniglobus]|uniref:Type II secretion system F family protein n=1 Tax=Synoicihabitans lomoniglobus TaxID=2909285 RepID=A0AAF0CP95_9BACT|nr:type II secretion system F family protein [Opitutaceae bacterium LMO-M01]WED65690.1 type II secretion system F family protein [Opitutaceae bacterium LMO-M01]
MPRFAFTARDRSGQSVTDELDAPSRKDALRRLQARGLQPMRLDERAGAAANRRAKKPKAAAQASSSSRSAPTPSLDRPGKGRKLSRAMRLPFLQALHDLTSSGLSAGEAVRLLGARIKDPTLRGLSSELWDRLSEGANLSRALQDFPQVFDESSINLLQAGEATGNLNDTLARLIEHLTQQREMKRQLGSALAYPFFMGVVATGVILFFLFFLLPRLQGLLDALGGELPWSTQLLVGMSDFALKYGIVVLVGAAFFLVSFWRWRVTESGRMVTDRFALRLPLLGPFVQSQTVLAFSQTLSVLLENGITTAEALRMTEKQIQNRVHRAAFDAATDRILEGEALSAALPETQCFPDLVLDKLSIGENTGNVVPSLKNIATTYRAEIADQLNVFTKVIASGVLLSVFLFVGFIAYAMVSAISTLSSNFNM